MIQTLYKLDSKGKIRMLEISTNKGIIIQKSGLIDGALTIHTNESKPKNIGKSNETTSEEQAILEATSKIESKLKEGYFKTIEEAKSEKIILPMLAKVYKDESHKIDWNNCYVQPKLDGMRCLTFPGNIKISRKNTSIENMDHIEVNLPATLNCVIDGELYVHGESFQKNMKYIKKYRAGLSEKIQYWVYDVISELPFIDRLILASTIVNQSKNCVLVETIKVNNHKEVIEAHKNFVKEGFEGTIIRWGNDSYAINKRSSNLLKHKDFIDETYKIVDVEPSDKDPEQGIIICETCPSGQRFGNGMKFSHEERKEILKNKENYIGQMAEIRFFEYTDDDLPRFPVCVGFRLDK